MKLMFILTFKGSLETWKEVGIVIRELECPLEYLKRGLVDKIQLYTYGANDPEILKTLDIDDVLKDRIEIICPDKPIQSLWGAIKHSFNFKKIKQAVENGCKIVKTNQINGSWTGWVAKFYGAKFYLRCGYILSRRFFKNGHYLRSMLAFMIELIGFNMADLCSVTTQDAKDYVSHYIWNKKKCFVAPTYVNTDTFNADVTKKEDDNALLYVGRFEPCKNTLALVEAAKMADVPLVMIGIGRLDNEVEAKAKALGVSLTRYRGLDNKEVAEKLRQYRYFILPSFHEGLPKVVIEAMAAEMICIGTPTSGITALIFDEKTGYLAKDFSAEAIADAIKKAQTDENNITYAKNARQFILDNHAIATYVDREAEMFKKFECL